MTAPRGKGLYTRRADLYPDSDPAAYAHAMECDFIAFYHLGATDDQIRRAQQLGFKGVLLYGMPGEWAPDTWRETYAHQADRVARLNLDGFIADVEDGGWLESGMSSEQLVLAASLAQAGQAFRSVGFLSYPSWPIHVTGPIMNASGVWGSPQLYGILEPASSFAVLKARAKNWRTAFNEMIPSL